MEQRAIVTFSLVSSIACLLVFPQQLRAEEPSVDYHPSAQERARAEVLPNKTFEGDLTGAWQVGNRARIGLKAAFSGGTSVFVQVQDVRTWGSEYNSGSLSEGTLTDYSANGLDMHQAYGEYAFANGAGSLRIGRQEITWHEQRLIGPVLWTHQGRSFDALRFQYSRERFGSEFFYGKLLERPVDSSEESAAFERWMDMHLFALRAGPRLGDPLNLDLVVISRLDQAVDGLLTTAGLHGKGKAGSFSWIAEAYGQFGQDDNNDYMAWMLGLRGGAGLGAAVDYLGLGFDLLSGDSDTSDSTVGVFDTLYATNHKFYGNMDLYLSIPSDTAAEGLMDAMLESRWALADKLKLKVDAHFFASAAPASSDTAMHGVELDTNCSWKPVDHLAISSGLWVYLPGAFYGSDPSPELGAYLTSDFNFK